MFKLGITTIKELQDTKRWITPILKRPKLASITLYEEALKVDNGVAASLSLSLKEF